jgi:hypothetical protein
MKNKANSLAITQGQGFKLEFENGYSLSVQIGTFNYCDNFYDDYKEADFSKTGFIQSTTCEMAIIKNGTLIIWPTHSEDYQTVGEYIPVGDIPKWINYVSNL